MKKKCLLLTGFACLLLAGCKDVLLPDEEISSVADDEIVDASIPTEDSGGKEADTDETGKKKIKIQFHVDSKTAEGIAYKKRVDAFNTQYKDKYVATAIFKTRTQGGADYEQQLISQKMEGTLPDIITFDAPNCASYAKAEILYNISNVYPAEDQNDLPADCKTDTSRHQPACAGI